MKARKYEIVAIAASTEEFLDVETITRNLRALTCHVVWEMEEVYATEVNPYNWYPIPISSPSPVPDSDRSEAEPMQAE